MGEPLKIQLDNGLILIIDEYFALEAKMKGVTKKLAKEFPRIASNALQRAIREHIEEKYPGSAHWDPSKVNGNGDGTVDVDIPGAGRAYHDVDIYPIDAQWLTIPLEPAKGTKVSDWDNTFKPKGKNIIAQVQNGSLVALFALSKHVHQYQDPSLMPSDADLAGTVGESVAYWLQNY